MALSISYRVESINPSSREPFTASLSCLPQELLEEIFSYLSAIDLQNAASVNRTLNRSVIAAVNFSEPQSVKKFVQAVIKSLDDERFSTQKELLLEIAQNIKIHKFPSLPQLKSYILNLKVQLVNVLKTIHYETRFDLEDQVQPTHFLEDIFRIASLEEDIDIACLIPNELQRYLALANVISDRFGLLHSGYIDRAIEVASSIPNEGERNEQITEIAGFLAMRGRIDEAIELTTSISNDYDKGFALQGICSSLLAANYVDRAIEVASSISHQESKGNAFINISKAIAESGNFDRAIEFALSISQEGKRGFALGQISRVIVETGHVDRAIEIALLISDKEEKEDAFSDISYFLLKNDDIDKATQVALLISNQEEKEISLWNISTFLLNKGNVDRSLSVAKLISQKSSRERLIHHISRLRPRSRSMMDLCVIQ